MVFKRNIIVFIFLILLKATALFSQNTESEAYLDLLFNQYIELETSALKQIESGEIDSQVLVKIDNMLLQTAEEQRDDLSSRLKMLRFAVETEISTRNRVLNADVFISKIAEAEKNRKDDIESARIRKNITGISIGTAAAAGVVFAVSSFVSQNYYDKYLQTEITDQAAFYLFWWQFLDNISTASAAVTIISSATAGIFTAARQPTI